MKKNYLAALLALAAPVLLWADEAATEAAAAVNTAAAETGAPQQAPQGGLNPMWMMLILLVAMYFLMIAPQRKQRKQREAMMAALKEGDKIMTQSGVYGVVKHIKEDTIRLQIDDRTNTTIELSKAAIASVINPPEEKPKA